MTLAVSLEILLAAYATLVGAVVGSYLNVLIHRLPRGEPTVVERSRCPHCGAPIRPWHNVPILGFLVLGGRCRDCRQPIHWRYPLVEALTALVFLASYRIWGTSLATLAAAFFGCLLIALAAIDLEHLLLPNRLTIPGIVAGLALQPWLPFASLRSAVIGAILGAAIVLALGGLWYVLHGAWGMGFGDAKLLAMIGAFLGWKGALVALGVAAVAGSVVALFGALLRRLDWQSTLPFGSLLAASALVALFVAGDAPSAYWGLFAGLEAAAP